MFAFVITIHIIVCALLILIVLIQQGRGGGLIGSLSSAESIFGTKTNAFLIKSTSVLAVVFFVTCLALAFLSMRKNKSLIETSYTPSATQPVQAASAPAAPAAQATPTPVSAAPVQTAPGAVPAAEQTPAAGATTP